MKLTLKEIADKLGAQLTGEPHTVISGVAAFDQAGPSDITFAADQKFLSNLEKTCAGAIIVPQTAMDQASVSEKRPLLYTENPKRSFFDLCEVFHPPEKIVPGIHDSAVIGDDVTIGKAVFIGPGVVISDGVQLGDHVQLTANIFIGRHTRIKDATVVKPNVTIMERSRIGSDCLIHAGTVIGSDGFGFTQSAERHEKIVHTGFVQIGDRVEIGACNTIDRGTLGKTRIGNGVKTDNLVHIAHNVEIGDNTLIVAQVGIAGSSRLGKNVIVAGKSGISGHINIGDNAIIGPYSGVHSDVKSGSIVSGIPQIPHEKWRQVAAILPRLPEMRKKLLWAERVIKKFTKKEDMEY